VLQEGAGFLALRYKANIDGRRTVTEIIQNAGQQLLLLPSGSVRNGDLFEAAKAMNDTGQIGQVQSVAL